MLQQADGEYSQDLVNCDGTNPTVVSNKGCLIPVEVFRNAPFSHAWGSSIFAKVSATNIKGVSAMSDAGNGAKIITKPDPPTNVQENTLFRSVTTLGIEWTAPVENGGSNVLDYRIYTKTPESAYF
jgi:hypothetical protein